MRVSAFVLTLLCLLAAPFGAIAHAQVTPWQIKIAASPNTTALPVDQGADGLAQTLRKLHTWASVMMIVAHPDDEDSGMLAYESRGVGARTALVTLTRGEGGQDAMSGAVNDALGLIRTNELLASDRYSGTQQYFSSVADFGFSKTLEESEKKWGSQRVLYDVVRAVRLYRPMILTSVFVGGPTDGHGQHQVSGKTSQLVFKLAGNPNVFPDQIKQGLRPWSPYKVYARTPFFHITSKGMFDYATNKWLPVRFYNYVSGQWSDHAPVVNVEIPEGNYDPVLGQSYEQIARRGWMLQKSQFGGGRPALPGPQNVGYHLYGSRVATPDSASAVQNNFFAGINTSLTGIATLARGNTAFLTQALRQIETTVDNATANYRPANPQAIAPTLAEGYRETANLINTVNASTLSSIDKYNVNHELKIKLAQFNTALAEALGLQLRAIMLPDGAQPRNFGLGAGATPTAVTPGSTFGVRLRITSAEPWTTGKPASGQLQLTRAWLAQPANESWTLARQNTNAATGDSEDAVFRVTVPSNAAFTQPYFTRPTPEQPYYNIANSNLLDMPFAPYPLAGWAEFTYDGVPIRIGQVVQTVHWEHGYGDIYQPLVVEPALSVNLSGRAGIVPLGTASFPLTVTVSNDQQHAAQGTLRLNLPAGWTAAPASVPFSLNANQSQRAVFTVHPAALATRSYTLRAEAVSSGHTYSEGVKTVGYPGLRPYYLYRDATYRVRGVNVELAPHLNIGYVMGTGDSVPQALAELGLHAHLLNTTDLSTGNLSQYSAILIGIRAYDSRPDLVANNARLLAYVHNGGTLIVQYQRAHYNNMGPYPLTLGNNPEKVVVETDPVKILASSNPLLQFPNRITAADFDGWVEERGHSFMSTWSPRYMALTETHDPGQNPQLGGLLVTRYGKGVYVYVAYALYRQFPAAIPGAYRILANLISAGSEPANFHAPIPSQHN